MGHWATKKKRLLLSIAKIHSSICLAPHRPRSNGAAKITSHFRIEILVTRSLYNIAVMCSDVATLCGLRMDNVNSCMRFIVNSLDRIARGKVWLRCEASSKQKRIEKALSTPALSIEIEKALGKHRISNNSNKALANRTKSFTEAPMETLRSSRKLPVLGEQCIR